MKQTCFLKGIAFAIGFFFLGISLVPVVPSTFSRDNVSTGSAPVPFIPHSYLEKNNEQKGRCDGLAPPSKPSPDFTNIGDLHPVLPGGRGYFYAYNAYDPNGMPNGIVTFDLDGVVEWIGDGPLQMSGSDYDPAGNWYAVVYSGGLWELPAGSGEWIYIGPTIPVNSLVIDTTTDLWYVCGADGSGTDSLFTINVTTAETTFIGHFGTPNIMISLMCDTDGNLFSYDVLFGGDSHLYSISKDTGVATVVGDMGYNFCYAQEGKFDRNVYPNILYLAAYDFGTGQSYLATCDPATAAVTIINIFNPVGIEIDGFAIPYTLLHYEHDVGVREIIAPRSGNAAVFTPEVTVKNYGNNSESSVPVTMMIVKNQYTDYMNEHFDGPFPPAGWTNIQSSDYWIQSFTNNAGGSSPEAILWYYYNFGGSGGLQTPFVDTSAATTLTLTFRSYIYWWGGSCMCQVEVTTDGGATWNDVSPWTNPLAESQGPKQYSIDISGYISTQTGVRFTYTGQYYWMYFWALDDVRLYSMQQTQEYNQTVETDIPVNSSVDLAFPTWTPADLGVTENMNLEYVVNATTQLPGDNNTNNDVKLKTIHLHYGYFHDVAITDIPSPKSGLAMTQIPVVNISNNGQNNENISVNMAIGKVLYNTLLTEDFISGVPPTGWGTDDPAHWESSPTNFAGGTQPEAVYNWFPSETGDFHLYTPAMDTTGWMSALLKYKEYVNDYNGDYTLKVQTSTDGGTTWNDAYTRAGGPYGPQTTQIYLTPEDGVGANNLMISWTYSGTSYNINFWYVDDVWIGQITTVSEYNQTVNASIDAGLPISVTLPDWTPGDIPLATTIDYLINASISMNVTDGNPSDNTFLKFITLSYEHDVGVTEITEPSGPPAKDITWFTYGGDNANSIGLTSGGTFEGAIRLTPTELAPFDGYQIVSVKYCHGMLSGSGEPATDGYMKIYGPGTATAPGALLVSEPFHTPAGNDWFQYDFQNPVLVDAYQDMWFSIECDNIPAGAYPLGVDAGPAIDGKADWASLDGGATWLELQIYGLDYNWNHMVGFGHIYPPPSWPTGTYHVAGIVENFGVIYPESNITVNAKITHIDNGTVMYNHDTLIPGPLAPGQTALASFPDVTFLNLTSWEGKYVAEIWTALPGDDHPENDKKTLTFTIELAEPPIPPNTNHTLTGTMGDNGWYISNVMITLDPYGGSSPPFNFGGGPKPPSGCHTYYKLQNADNWTEYNATPVWVNVSGTYNLSYYSIDNYNQSDPVKGPFLIKIDMIAPVFINFTATPVNTLKTKWLLDATVFDTPSNVARIDFYVDDAFIGNLTSAPWQFYYQGKGQKAQAAVFDNAGNSAMSNQVQVYELTIDAQPAVQVQLLVVQQSILRHIGRGNT